MTGMQTVYALERVNVGTPVLHVATCTYPDRADTLCGVNVPITAAIAFPSNALRATSRLLETIHGRNEPCDKCARAS